jgi:nucleoside-diphosphate-sugar epimerase
MNGNDEIYRGQRVLITGGYGFVGAHLANRLLAAGAEVWALDRDTDPQRPSLINCPGYGIRERIYTVTGDVTDTAQMTSLLKQAKFDYIFNCAAHAAVIEKAVEQPGKTIHTNTMGVVALLEAVRATGHTPRGIFHASTDKVYGELDGPEYQEELTPLRAIGVYDASKLAADILARTYHEVFSMPVTILRMCNLIGPYDFNTEYRLVPKSLDTINKGGAPELYLDSLDHHREYLYIDDAVEVILELTARPACIGEAYNLMGCAHLSTREAMEQVISAAALVAAPHDLAQAAEIRSRGYTVVDRDASGRKIISLKRQRLNAEKLRAAIEFRPRTSFGDGLFRCAEFYHRIAHRLPTPPATEAHHANAEATTSNAAPVAAP